VTCRRTAVQDRCWVYPGCIDFPVYPGGSMATMVHPPYIPGGTMPTMVPRLHTHHDPRLYTHHGPRLYTYHGSRKLVYPPWEQEAGIPTMVLMQVHPPGSSCRYTHRCTPWEAPWWVLTTVGHHGRHPGGYTPSLSYPSGRHPGG